MIPQRLYIRLQQRSNKDPLQMQFLFEIKILGNKFLKFLILNTIPPHHRYLFKLKSDTVRE